MTSNGQRKGLSTKEAKILQLQHGKNILSPQKKDSFWRKLLHVVAEPMFLLLIAAAVLYFLLGEPLDGSIMMVFVTGVISIELIQEWKTDRTLKALKELSAPTVAVLRDGAETRIASEDLVPGDLMLIHEGVKIPADGSIVQCGDLRVDESSLTGESEAVWKTQETDSESDSVWRRDRCYAGTLVLQGTGMILVDQTGLKTEYGKIGAHVAEAPDVPTPLQKQTGKLVKFCTFFAAILFALVGAVSYLNASGLAFRDRIVQSVLSGITLAMAMIPEEFPVILTVFLSMGAWRLAKKQALVRRLPAVETLGAVSVLCVDKTGTITENRMTVQDTWTPSGERRLLRAMGLACEPEAYDPMEKAMLSHCEQNGLFRDSLFRGDLLLEYPFTNETKIMGHVWRGEGILLAAKGSPEHLLPLCEMTRQERDEAEAKIAAFSRQGLRVISVASAAIHDESSIPATLPEAALQFVGLVGLMDPPRETVSSDIALCVRAGVRVVMITGDNGVTAASIARQIGMPNAEAIITGDMIERMDDGALQESVKTVSIFSRVLPEHKMRIIKAFQANGEVVAMTGDGVNDAAALKYADIGIAMGKRGSEVSREAADIILMDDRFTTIVDTIRDGRRIYDNIRKAIGYVFTIHIPIALASLVAPMLKIPNTDLLLLPLHVMLMELVIDPTCSIVLERQPAECDIMDRKARGKNEKLILPGLLLKSAIQGLVLFAASFIPYYLAWRSHPENAPLARSYGFIVLMLANLFLVQITSSSTGPAYRSIKTLFHDKMICLIHLITIAGLLIILYTPLCGFMKLAPLPLSGFLLVALLAAGSVFWYEIVKVVRKRRQRRGWGCARGRSSLRFFSSTLRRGKGRK